MPNKLGGCQNRCERLEAAGLLAPCLETRNGYRYIRYLEMSRRGVVFRGVPVGEIYKINRLTRFSHEERKKYTDICRDIG